MFFGITKKSRRIIKVIILRQNILIMNSKIKNKVEEPAEIYEVSKKEVISEELHPVLVQLLEKSMQQAKEGKTFTHEEVMKMTREKYPFLK